MDKSIGTPPSLEQKEALPKLWQQDGNIIHVFKMCISIFVATDSEASKMSYWCLVMSFWGLGLSTDQSSSSKMIFFVFSLVVLNSWQAVVCVCAKFLITFFLHICIG